MLIFHQSSSTIEWPKDCTQIDFIKSNQNSQFVCKIMMVRNKFMVSPALHHASIPV